MPQMGFDMQEGTVVRWLKEVGSEVTEEEPIAEIETDKAVVEFESYASGVLHSILVPEGATVPVGQPIAVLRAADEAPGELSTIEERPAAEATPTPVAVPPVDGTARPDATVPASPDEIRASPVARRLAAERGVELADIAGTGPGGRITKDDVLGFEGVVAAPAPEASARPEPPQQEEPATRAELGAADADRTRKKCAGRGCRT